MLLLLDIGNTHTHLGLAEGEDIVKSADFRTQDWFSGAANSHLCKFTGRSPVQGISLCSVVPRVTPLARQLALKTWQISPLVLNAKTVTLVKINYPRPATIGPDRLANAVAVKYHFGVPAVVVDFGTAVTLRPYSTLRAVCGTIVRASTNSP